MSMQLRAFRPLAATQNTVVTATAQTVTLNYTLGTNSVRFVNVGTAVVFVLQGEVSQTAATVSNAIPILPNTERILTFSQGTTTYSVIAAGTGSTLYSTVGEGR